MILQEFINTQEEFNSEILYASSHTNQIIGELLMKNENLTKELNEAKSENEDFRLKIQNISLEIKLLQKNLQFDSEAFVWKVLLISFLACLSFFIFIYCFFSLFNTKQDEVNQEKEVFIGRIEKRKERSHSVHVEIKQKQQKVKKNKDKIPKKVKSMQLLQDFHHFSQVIAEKKEENLIKRSNSDEERSILWGLSPRQFSKYLLKKFVIDF